MILPGKGKLCSWSGREPKLGLNAGTCILYTEAGSCMLNLAFLEVVSWSSGSEVNIFRENSGIGAREKRKSTSKF